MTEALWAVVGAVVGALAATWLSSWLGRPKPTLIVDTVQVTSQHLRNELSMAPDHDLVSACDDYPLALGDLDTARAVSEASYVHYLSVAQERLRDFVAIRIPRMQQSVGEFRTLVATDDYERADRLFARDQQDLWATLEGGNLRGPIAFKGTPDYSKTLAVHEVVKDTDGDFVIPLTGPRNLVFAWSPRKGGQREASRRLAERCAEAFAHHAKDDLLDIADYLRADLEQLTVDGERLADRLDAALSPYRRLLVAGILANQGGAPYSVGNRAKIVVLIKGFPRSGAHDADRGFIDDDAEVALRIGATQEHLTDPLVIEGGGAVRFVGLSEEYLSVIQYGPELLEAFHSSDRNSYVVVSATLPGTAAAVPVYSGDFLFRDIGANPSLPRKR